VPFRTTAYDVVVDGNDLWLATGYGIALYDRTVDPPKLTAITAVPQTTRLVRVANGLAYAAGSDSIAILRKNGKQLQIASTITTTGAVNDLLLTTNYLYVATKSGLAQYDLLDPLHPVKTPATFATSTANVTSIVLTGSILFAADGDTSIESFDLTTPLTPQKRTNLASIAQAATVNVNNGRLYVSNGQQTEVFLTPTATPSSAAVVALATTSVAPIAGDALFVAGNDRRVRGFDLTVAGSPIELYRSETPATAGNVNRIQAMATAGGRLYVAAGDGGLVTYDISGFTAPFALRSYATATPPSSVFSLGDRVYVALAGGGITEYTQNPAGQLGLARTWDGSHVDVIRDGASGFLLTTTGANATLWTLTSTIPVSISNTTFPAPVVSAALIGTTAIAVLFDGTTASVATADMSQASPTPQVVTIAGAVKLNRVARSGTAVVFVQENTDAGTTSLFYFSNGTSLGGTPRTATVAGAPVGGVALGGQLAAMFTFNGINIIDFSVDPGSVRTLGKASTALPIQFVFSGTSLLEVTQTELLVWSTTGSGGITQRYSLPSPPVALHIAGGSTIADIGTSSGVSSVALTSLSLLPAPLPSGSGNEFYRKVVAGGSRVYLFDGTVDILTNGLAFVSSAGSGLVDLAASSTGFFTVNGTSVVTAWTGDGIALKSATVATGIDAQPLALFSVGNALWLSLSRGCLSTGCEKVTLVLDPVTLTQTDQLTGGVTDVAVAGTTAYALTDFPKEIRVYSIANAAHPAQTASRAITETPAPTAIAGDATNAFVLGERLVTYTAASLTPVATQLDSFLGATGANTYTDQHLRGSAPCIFLTGRNANALYSTANPAAWTATLPFDAPSFVRSAAFVPGTFYLLTDHSLEVVGTGAVPKPAKKKISR
jgi:hypothetical protein